MRSKCFTQLANGYVEDQEEIILHAIRATCLAESILYTNNSEDRCLYAMDGFPAKNGVIMLMLYQKLECKFINDIISYLTKKMSLPMVQPFLI